MPSGVCARATPPSLRCGMRADRSCAITRSRGGRFEGSTIARTQPSRSSTAAWRLSAARESPITGRRRMPRRGATPLLRVSGEIVRGLQAVFAENWLEASGELLVDEGSYPVQVAVPSSPAALVVGSTPTAGLSTRARVLMQLMLASARQSIELCSPYFIPDAGIRRELIAARKRGVQVRVLTGGRHSDHLLAWRAGRRRYAIAPECGRRDLRVRTAHDARESAGRG